jgi:hypothetical protein
MVLALGSIRVVEVLRSTTRRVTSTAAVTTALEALETVTTAGKTTATTSDDAPHDTKYNETSKNHDTNYWPSGTSQ